MLKHGLPSLSRKRQVFAFEHHGQFFEVSGKCVLVDGAAGLAPIGLLEYVLVRRVIAGHVLAQRFKHDAHRGRNEELGAAFLQKRCAGLRHLVDLLFGRLYLPSRICNQFHGYEFRLVLVRDRARCRQVGAGLVKSLLQVIDGFGLYLILVRVVLLSVQKHLHLVEFLLRGRYELRYFLAQASGNLGGDLRNVCLLARLHALCAFDHFGLCKRQLLGSFLHVGQPPVPRNVLFETDEPFAHALDAFLLLRDLVDGRLRGLIVVASDLQGFSGDEGPGLADQGRRLAGRLVAGCQRHRGLVDGKHLDPTQERQLGFRRGLHGCVHVIQFLLDILDVRAAKSLLALALTAGPRILESLLRFFVALDEVFHGVRLRRRSRLRKLVKRLRGCLEGFDALIRGSLEI
mmetsp:Transcript_52647/g.146658  ORF Transcript_52647/g.146658 Transcript_52647/m.146658 type:complete len:402 (+) Transcript_52647:2438-3643(+)